MAVSLPLVELVASTPWTGDQIRVTKQYHTTRVYLSRIYLILPLRDYSMAAIYVPKNHIANKNLMATHGSFFRGAQTNPIIGDGMTLAAFGGSLINSFFSESALMSGTLSQMGGLPGRTRGSQRQCTASQQSLSTLTISALSRNISSCFSGLHEYCPCAS